MKLKLCSVAVLLGLYCCYSYSETIYGNTTNAAAAGNSWSLTPLVPSVTGLQINGVIYQYTTQKNPIDQFSVTVQHQNAQGNGYIFRSTDDWSGLPGNTIRKAVPIDNVPIQAWGTGEIRSSGQGLVVNPSVTYFYKYDECAVDALISPSCPGYIEALMKLYDMANKDANFKDPMYDEIMAKATDNKTILESEEKIKEKELKDIPSEENRRQREQLGLNAAKNSLLTAETVANSTNFFALNNIQNFDTYKVAMPGGRYDESVRINDAKLPDNRNGLRNNWAQQLKHKQMVDSQYKQ